MNQSLKEKYLKELAVLKKKLKRITKKYEEEGWDITDHEAISEFESWRFQIQSLLKKILPETDDRIIVFNQLYFPVFGKIVVSLRLDEIFRDDDIRIPQTYGIIDSIIEDIQRGLFDKLENEISGIIFDSILETGRYLLSKGYKDAAAIYGRIALEQTIRKLCSRQDPPIEFNEKTKASVLNEDLKKREALTQPEWRQNQAWLDIGNKAAHGEWTEYDADKVERMLDGIAEFMAKKL